MSLNSSSTAAGSTTPPRPDEKKVLATNNKESVRHSEHARDTEKGRLALASDAINDDVNAKLANPLAGWTAYELAKDGERFAREHGLEDLIPALRKGAMRELTFTCGRRWQIQRLGQRSEEGERGQTETDRRSCSRWRPLLLRQHGGLSRGREGLSPRGVHSQVAPAEEALRCYRVLFDGGVRSLPLSPRFG